MIKVLIDRAVVEQSLEALDGLSEDAVCQSSHHAKKDRHTSLDVCPVFLRLRAAITALKAALAEPEEPQEPVSVTDLQQALVKTNLIDHDALFDPDGYDEGVTLERVDALHELLFQRPAEPVGIVSSLVKGGVVWQRWPADMPDGTRLFSEVQP